MTVAELMTELAKWPPDLEVFLFDYVPQAIRDIERIPEGLVIV